MKILAITSKSPYPLHEGRALRTYNLLREMARRHEVHLASYIQTDEDAGGIDHMRGICPVVRGVPLYREHPRRDTAADALRELASAAPLPIVKYDTTAMRRVLAQLLAQHRYDLVHLDILHVACLADALGGLPTVLNQHNVEAMILERRAQQDPRPLARMYLRYQARKMRHFETQACRRATQVVAVSQADADVLAQWTGRQDITVVPNGVDTGFFQPFVQAPQTAELVYVGGFTWFPNEDAVQSFVAQTLPLIAQQVPEVRLTVVGKNPDSASVRALAAHPRVRLLGMVDDIRPHVAEAAVYVVPLRIGGGTRLKILDALAMGKAIVSTSIGCEGLAVTPGLDIEVADDPQAFATSVVMLLRDPQRAQQLGKAGRVLVERRYEWGALGQMLEAGYRRAEPGDRSG